MYYNTTLLKNTELKEANKRALSQDKIVLGIFQKANKDLGASDVWNTFLNNEKRPPITSIRRSINTLYNLGYLEDTKTYKMGIFSRKEKVWKLDSE